jgi:hypothetical protein
LLSGGNLSSDVFQLQLLFNSELVDIGIAKTESFRKKDKGFLRIGKKSTFQRTNRTRRRDLPIAILSESFKGLHLLLEFFSSLALSQ